MIAGLHIELTNKCTLKCPRCARTTFIEKFGLDNWHNADLELDTLEQFLDIDLTNLRINLCGNYGDPIYHYDLINIVKFLKSKNANINITTNGSYKKEEWWQQLSNELTESDVITFSIDGLPTNFTKYRINADWNSIELAIRTVSNSKTKSVWKYIPFSYNENDIDQTRTIAYELGIDEFIVMPSNRWEKDDWLKPKSYIGPRQEQKINWVNGTRNNAINPKCNTGTEHYISADGYYMPCCYVGDWRFYYKSEFFKNRKGYDISKTTLSQLLVTDNLKKFYNNITIHSADYCTFNCPK